MPSEAQISANRRNAKLSTGPRSEAGRARSSMNALKSGIHAKSEIIPGENPDELAALTAEYYQSVQPQGREEAVLVDQLISADWQLRRLRHSEAGIYTKFMSGELNQTSAGWAYMKNADTLDRCYRNQAAISRNLRASLDSLLRLRRNAGLLQPSAEQNEPNPEHIAPPASAADDETNPIPEPLAPASAADETNPIPSSPSPHSPLPPEAPTHPQPQPPDSGQSPASTTPTTSKPARSNPFPMTRPPEFPHVHRVISDYVCPCGAGGLPGPT
jgi:hypothetical protein